MGLVAVELLEFARRAEDAAGNFEWNFSISVRNRKIQNPPRWFNRTKPAINLITNLILIVNYNVQ